MNSDEIRQKLLSLVREFDTAMLVSTSSSWGMRARPMAIAEVDELGGVWFVTSVDTSKADEISAYPMVNLTMQGKATFVSLTGTARFHQEPARLKSMWKEPWRVWFPEGPEQADLTLVRVQPTSGEFWDNRGTKGLRYLWEATKAYAKGERPEATGENAHGKTSL